jgi:anti-sigma-K factor RskA
VSTSWPEHPLDDVASYAVGALDPDDARELEAHLATCDRCQAELAAHRQALAALVPNEEPPPGLWDRIAASLPDEPASADGAGDRPDTGPGAPGTPPVRGRIEIRPRALRTPEGAPAPPPPGPGATGSGGPGAPAGATGPGPASTGFPGAGQAGPGHGTVGPGEPFGTPTGPARPGEPFGASGGPAGRPGAGAEPYPGQLAAVPGTGASADRPDAPLHLAGRPRRRGFGQILTGAAAAVVLVVAAVAATLALTDDEGDDGQPPEVAAPADTQELAEAAAQDPTRQAEMASPTGQPVARLVSSESGSYVLFDDLPPLSAERAYQLWSLDAAQPVSLGVLGDGRAGAVAVAVPDSTTQVAISDAPAGGEPAPTGPIVATGSLQAV